MKKAVILFSGGVDSTTCLAMAQDNGFECHLLSFDYGQKHHAELNASKVISTNLGVIDHQVAVLPMNLFQGSSLTNDAEAVPDAKSTAGIPSTYVPARNTIFLSFGLAYCETIGASALYIGSSFVDYSGYPDCRPEYFEAAQQLFNVATKQTTDDGGSIAIHAPLLHLSKADTIKAGIALGVDYGMTVSCYRATEEGLACGTCDSCHLRKKGFEEAGVKDPTRYL